MKWGIRRLAALSVLMLGLTAFGGGVADAAQPIKPHQHFIGLVNGQGSQAVVYTFCAGGVYQGETGPVVGGQTMSVERSANAGGNTGLFSQIYAWFVPTSNSGTPKMLKFTTYGTQPIPTSIQVPCYGSGKVEFSSCPYLAPCAAGWVPYFVDVTFQDVAV